MRKPQQQEALFQTDGGEALRADVARVLKEILERRTQRDGADWTEETLFADTGLDSFDAIECVFELEEHYKVEIDFNANDPASKVQRVGDFVDMATRSIIAKSET